MKHVAQFPVLLSGPIGRAAKPVAGSINNHRDSCAHNEHRDDQDEDSASQGMKGAGF